jgi:hypothetical protein
VSLLRLAPVVLLVALAAVLPPAGSAANECSGLQKCIAVPGPWVAVPSAGEVDFLLECPKKAIAAGTSALVSTQEIHVSFDGILGSPVAYGRTTNFEVLFRAVSGNHRPGIFKPFLGCLPTPSGTRNTTGVAALPVGAPLDLRATTITLTAGAASSASIGCTRGERLVDSWTATGFASVKAPPAALASAIRVHQGIAGARASASAGSSDGVALADHALVQLGVRCTPG